MSVWFLIPTCWGWILDRVYCMWLKGIVTFFRLVHLQSKMKWSEVGGSSRKRFWGHQFSLECTEDTLVWTMYVERRLWTSCYMYKDKPWDSLSSHLNVPSCVIRVFLLLASISSSPRLSFIGPYHEEKRDKTKPRRIECEVKVSNELFPLFPTGSFSPKN